ncbi:unnamed protein product [Moneuplotes crassus]|uniref:AP2/ERF domain-containing protein n=1 Tax=Euplotes crassus TaxID=5936 RepID=A0AAD1Y889_EUPCR|nr:unnamed protein product [Moneuplotes crassus]
MDSYTNQNLKTYAFKSVCGYSRIMKELVTLYCCCSPMTEMAPYMQAYCVCQNLCSCPAQAVEDANEANIDNNLQAYAPSYEQKQAEKVVTDIQQDKESLNLIDKPVTRNKDHSRMNESVDYEESKTPVATRVFRNRRRRSSRLDIRARLIRLRTRIQNGRVTGFQSSRKKTRGTTDTSLGRRSKYIGVSKNNANWQALINQRNTKKYIGTFTDELEAARTYDLYAMAVQAQKACLNFSYSTQEVEEMVDYFIAYKAVNMAAFESVPN